MQGGEGRARRGAGWDDGGAGKEEWVEKSGAGVCRWAGGEGFS